jgi:hypothetical protein
VRKADSWRLAWEEEAGQVRSEPVLVVPFASSSNRKIDLFFFFLVVTCKMLTWSPCSSTQKPAKLDLTNPHTAREDQDEALAGTPRKGQRPYGSTLARSS